jgi:predicted RNase H-like HicB family nuclease
VPDLPGCVSGGATVGEALDNVREAIELHLEGMLMDGEPLPPPRSIETYLGDPSYRDGTWALVDVDLSRLDSKARRINITVAERVLALIDDAARRENETRSGFLARVALEYISRYRKAS